MRFLLFIVFALLISTQFAALSFAVDDPDREATLRRLEDIEARLNDALESLEQKRSAEFDLLDELDDVEQALRQKQQKVKRTNRQLASLRKEIEAQKKELDKHKKEIDKLQGQVQRRLVALYKSEESGTLKTLFSANSAAQMLEDYDFLGRIVKYDRNLLEEYRQHLKARQDAIARLSSSKTRQQRLLADLKSEEGELKRTRKLKERFLAAVRRDRNALNSVVTDLRKRAARLTSLVSGLESGRGGEYTKNKPLFPLQKGLLPWPVNGRIKVGFGTKKHPELGTLIESHGIEISAEPDTPIKAVWSGRVAFAKRFQGYGNLLILDHEDGYYTLYAQAAKLLKKAGDQVAKGETVAVSGYGDSDFVYFEIRNGRTPLDPTGWIARR